MAKALRPYQVAQADAVMAGFAEHRSVLVVAATGLGKTELAFEVMRRTGGACLFLAHRKTLVEQTARRMEAAIGGQVEIEMGEFYTQWRGSTVASVQSLSSERRLRRARPDAVSLVVADEAHHYTAESFRRILDHFPGAKVLGLTATPDRADKTGLKAVFEHVAHRYDLDAAVPDAWLCDAVRGRSFLETMLLEDVTVRGGDFVESKLAAEMLRDKETAKKIAHDALSKCGDLPTIIFTPGVELAKLVTEILNAERDGCARSVDGETPDYARQQMFPAFERGDFQFLANCGVTTEGWDCPPAACVFMARPTKSRSLYVQMIGRVLRPLDGVLRADMSLEERRAAIAASRKPVAKVIDVVGNSGRHSLVGPLDVLAGNEPEPVRRAAAKLMEREGMTAMEAVAIAKQRAAERAEREDARRRAAAARSKVTREAEWVPLRGVDARPDVAGDGGVRSGALAVLSPKQVHAFGRCGITAATLAEMQPGQARFLLNLLAPCGWPRIGDLSASDLWKWTAVAKSMRNATDEPSLRVVGEGLRTQRLGGELRDVLRDTYARRRDVLRQKRTG